MRVASRRIADGYGAATSEFADNGRQETKWRELRMQNIKLNMGLIAIVDIRL